jgi:Protein of unknown function (DUF2567)
MTDPSPTPGDSGSSESDSDPAARAEAPIGQSPFVQSLMVPSLFAPAPAPPNRIVRTAIAAVLVGVAVAALGAAVGWFWAAITPRLQVIKGDNVFLYADPEPEQPVAADGTFLLIGLGLGIVIAVLAWLLLRRYRGVAMLAALTIGSLASSILAFWVGHKIGLSQFNAVRGSAPIGAQLSAPVTLRITDEAFTWKDFHWLPSGVVAGQALAAAFVYTSLAGFSSFDDLGRHRRRGEPEMYGSLPAGPATAEPPAAEHSAPEPPAPEPPAGPRSPEPPAGPRSAEPPPAD